MNRYKLFLPILILFLCSCHRELIENLRLVDNVYVDKDGTPYNGVAKSHYTSGELSGKVNFNNGVPEGEWTSYGYKEDLIQSGNYQIYHVKLKRISLAAYIVRVSLSNFHEGNQQLTDIYIITNSFRKEFKIQDNPKLFHEVFNAFKSNNIPLDTTKVHRIIFANGELEQ